MERSTVQSCLAAPYFSKKSKQLSRETFQRSAVIGRTNRENALPMRGKSGESVLGLFGSLASSLNVFIQARGGSFLSTLCSKRCDERDCRNRNGKLSLA